MRDRDINSIAHLFNQCVNYINHIWTQTAVDLKATFKMLHPQLNDIYIYIFTYLLGVFILHFGNFSSFNHFGKISIICYYSGCQSKKSMGYFMNFILCGISIRCCKTMLKNICKHNVIPGAESGKDQLSFESFFSDPAHILAALDFSISFKWRYWQPLPPPPPSSTSPRA